MFLVLPCWLFAQNRYDRPPHIVDQSFHNDYPKANATHWHKYHGQWHADFNDPGEDGRGEMVAHYSERGRHIDSHIPYDLGDVPQPVVERAQSKYHGGSHFRYTKMESGEGNGFFQVRVNLHGRDHTVYMDEEGRERNYDDRH